MKTRLLYILLLVSSISFAQTVYVDANATGSNNGTSWANAYTSLQTALTNVTANGEIWIAKGTYSPGTARTDTFTIDTNNVTIYGGFAGTETNMSDRDISLIHTTNSTILSGDANGNDTPLTSGGNTSRNDNNYHVVTLNANNVVIDGVSIQDGYANQSSGVNSYGASINVAETSKNFILRNCEVKDNYSIKGGLRAYFTVNTQLTIENCKFTNNYSRYGAGLYVLTINTATLTVNITNTLFTNNTSFNILTANSGFTGSSAWIRAHDSGSTITTNIVNCTFADNVDTGTASGTKGTLVLSERQGSHTATISNSIFYGNTRYASITPSVNHGHDSPATVTVYNSIGEDSFSNLTNLTNISSANPNLTADFKLQSNSGDAINGGDNSKIPSNITKDLAGNDRIINTTVDMGAYESNFNSPSNVKFVNKNATGNNDGSSWANAYTSLQTALTNVTTNGKIWIAKGTYTPGTARTDTFTIGAHNVAIYGGFAGTETNISDRDMSLIHTTNSTILSGDIGTVNNNSDNAYHVVTLNANNVVIDGVSIQDGYANQLSGANSYGASINVKGTSKNLILRNCEVKNNLSQFGGLRAAFSVNTQIRIENCKFTNNLARYGSGLYIYTENNATLTVNITNTLFTNNSSLDIDASTSGYTGSSAWIRAYGSGSTVTTNIVNCTFADNQDNGTASGDKGTLALSKYQGSHTATISNSIFYGNTRNGATSLSVNNGNSLSATVTVLNSIGEDGFSNIVNKANISNANPNLTTDFKLQAGSPAIDSGDNSRIPSGITTDLAGNARIINTTVDMGAYEFDASASINDEVFNDAISMYPNPVRSTLNISSKNTTIEKVAIYNLLGKKVMESTQTSINVSNLTNGVYILKAQSTDKKVAVKKFIKK